MLNNFIIKKWFKFGFDLGYFFIMFKVIKLNNLKI